MVQIAFNNPYVAIAVGLGYIIGEGFGWGLWVGNLTSQMSNTIPDDGEGKNSGIQYLARKIVPNYETNMVKYCQVALAIRGMYWWIPTLAPLYFVGFSPFVLLIAILILSVGFPFSCWNGYLLQDVVNFNKYGFSIVGGWEIQEVAYGIIQDIVILILLLGI